MLRRRFVALGIVATLAACGGGGGSSSSPAGKGSIPASSGMAPASFTITVPSTSTSALHRRAPRNVPSGTQSISFTLLKTTNTGVTTPQTSPVYPLLATSPGCTTGTGGISCTIQLSAPVGQDIYLAQVFATPDGSGTHIGSGAVLLTVVANATNTASLTLAGPIAAAYVATDDVPIPNFFSDGTILGLSPVANATYNEQTIPQSARVFVVALDAQGNQIITPDTFDRPVALTLNLVQTGYVEDALYRRSPQGGGPNDPTTYALLTTTYAFPTGGVTSASTSSGNPSINIESPADQTVITALSTSTGAIISITSAIAGSPQPLSLTYAVVNGTCPSGDTGTPPFSCSGPTPTPTPSSSPTPTPTPTPSPTPTPTASPTPLMWPTDYEQNEYGTAVYYPANSYTIGNSSTPIPIPMTEFNTLPQEGGNTITLALSGGATMTTGGTVTLDTSQCEGNIILSPASPITTNGSPISVTVLNNAVAAMGCIVNASDGITTAPMQVYVDQFGVIVNRVKRRK